MSDSGAPDGGDGETPSVADRYSQEPEAAALARRQLYVAMTRAQEQLYLFGSGNLPIIGELQQSRYLGLG